jgi:hypothetical protein
LGQEVGPVSFQDMAEMVRAGTLKEDDQVRRKGTSQWIPAREVVGLFREAKKQPARTAPAGGQTKPASPPGEPDAQAHPEPQPRRSSKRQVLLAVGIVAAMILVMGLVTAWRSGRSERFPEPQAGKPRPLDQMTINWRPPPPEECSVPGLEKGVPQLVPGLEHLDPAWAPTLTGDLCTIVFAAPGNPGTGEDLYLATRSDASEPFGPPRRIESCVSRQPERMPALSPEGLDLFFVRGHGNPRYFHSARQTDADDFGEPVVWLPPNLDMKDKVVGRPQLYDRLHLKLGMWDLVAKRNLHFVAERASPQSPFGSPQPFPLPAGVMVFFAGNARRGYWGTEEGLLVSGRHELNERWPPPIPIVDFKATGPIERGVWVAPGEDVIFYCSPGPGKELGSSKRLWMMRF